MALQKSEVFAAALEGCRKLQTEFPSDRRLQSIVKQLEEWTLSLNQQNGPGQSRLHKRTRKLESADIRPISEDLARVVCDASAEAKRLGLC